MASLDCVLPAICKIIFSFHYFKIFFTVFQTFCCTAGITNNICETGLIYLLRKRQMLTLSTVRNQKQSSKKFTFVQTL